MGETLPLLSQRKWYSRVPYGYARGWEPVIYVNNIRAYYNILKWLTEKEEAQVQQTEQEAPQLASGSEEVL